jgi:hypothetical protein
MHSEREEFYELINQLVSRLGDRLSEIMSEMPEFHDLQETLEKSERHFYFATIFTAAALSPQEFKKHLEDLGEQMANLPPGQKPCRRKLKPLTKRWSGQDKKFLKDLKVKF